jgi:hypothetical protein
MTQYTPREERGSKNRNATSLFDEVEDVGLLFPPTMMRILIDYRVMHRAQAGAPGRYFLSFRRKLAMQFMAQRVVEDYRWARRAPPVPR